MCWVYIAAARRERSKPLTLSSQKNITRMQVRVRSTCFLSQSTRNSGGTTEDAEKFHEVAAAYDQLGMLESANGQIRLVSCR